MPKTIPVLLEAHYLLRRRTLTVLLEITRRDGEVFGFTEHDRNLTIDGVQFPAASGLDLAAVETSSSLAQQGNSTDGALTSAAITQADLEAGVWDLARYRLLRANWADVSQGVEILSAGKLGRVTRSVNQFRAELLGMFVDLANNLLGTFLPTCPFDLGDDDCQVNLAGFTHTTTITTVTDRRNFTASGLAQAADYFTAGKLTVNDGDNAGYEMEVKQHQAAGVITLLLSLPYTLTVGTSITVIAGCRKRHQEDCIDTFSNGERFGGYPYIVGQDRLFSPEPA
jgi:uncharacterized phage protein (TIGR02218 family)